MADQRSFLFVTWEGGGNVPPVLGLASRLIERGHRVCVLTEPCLEDSFRHIGAEFRAFTAHFNRVDPTVDIIKDWKPKPLQAPVVDHVMVRPALDVALETRDALHEFSADIVVADLIMLGSLIAAEALGVARVALFHMPEYLPGPGRPPGGLGLKPMNSWLGRFRDRTLSRVFYRVINQYLPRLNLARRAFELPPLTSLDDLYHEADLRLIQTCREFDTPLDPPPSNVRYVGPVLDNPTWMRPESNQWPADDEKPLVVVGLSTTFQNQKGVLQRIMTAVAPLDIRCLVPLGPGMAGESFDVPENVTVVPSAPHSDIFPYARAVITHAGHGTVMGALAHGLPMVCLPMGRDQVDNAALVAHHGAGIDLNWWASVRRIRRAVMRVLNPSHYAEGAKALQPYVQEAAASDLAVEELEALNISGSKSRSEKERRARLVS